MKEEELIRWLQNKLTVEFEDCGDSLRVTLSVYTDEGRKVIDSDWVTLPISDI